MTETATIEALLADATERLRPVSESPRLDAELLVARAIDMPRSYLFAHPEDVLDPAAVQRLEATLGRRLAGEPMAYITGSREFWSLELAVSPATLVPRPETELVVDIALRDIPRRATPRIVDLGTGSGAIALALAHERRLASVTGVDIDADALAIARQNAASLMLDNIVFVEGDWVMPVAGQRFDVIVSNPPYVAAGDPALTALAAEPRIALVAGTDGLDAIRILADVCRDIAAPAAALILEHGAGQQAAVAGLLAAYGWDAIQCYDDYAGRPRVTRAVFPDSETP